MCVHGYRANLLGMESYLLISMRKCSFSSATNLALKHNQNLITQNNDDR